jgi:hypothetical protein
MSLVAGFCLFLAVLTVSSPYSTKVAPKPS